MKKIKVKKIHVSDKIRFSIHDLVDADIDDLRSRFTWSLKDEYFTILDEYENSDIVELPSNAWWVLDYEEVVDDRMFPLPNKSFEFKGKLKKEQEAVSDSFLMTKSGNVRSGIYQAPCGWGKTFAGTHILANCKTKPLVLLHTKLLMNQWVGELKNLVPDATIGIIGDGHDTTGDIDVGIYKSVVNRLPKVRDRYGLTLVDEVHLCPADMFSNCLNGINSKFKIGVSATPRRKDGRHVALPYFFTPFMVEADDPDKKSAEYCIVKTDIPFNVIDPKRDWARQLNKLSQNEKYLDLIVKHVQEDVARGRVLLVLFPRLEMLSILNGRIPDSVQITGSTTNREEILSKVGTKYKVVLSTTIFDEGVSCHRIDTFYNICPENNPIKREQRIGRIQRDHPDSKYPRIKDFFLKGKFVDRQQKQREHWYKAQGFKEIYDYVL